MIGRKVRSLHRANDPGVVVEYDPLSAAMTDARVKHDSGLLMWYASGDLRPLDGKPLPSRTQVKLDSALDHIEWLRSFRAELIENWNVPWPGMNFGKVHVGNAANEAIARVEEEITRLKAML